MLIRYFSDLHIDLNRKSDFPIDDNNIFTIIAGDISGNPFVSTDWINNNIKQGLFVAGNHIVYNSEHLSISDWKNYLSNEFPLTGPISFLENNYKEINNIIFIGCTLYTDYKYGGDYQLNLINSGLCLNDFRFGLVGDKLKPLIPQDYADWFKESFNYIKSIVENNPNKEIVIITHHCPSPRCISSEHKNSNINSSFVSDLESFIETHDNIKCWICGHVHNQVEEKINNCLLVCNPLGYMKRNENPNWTINKFINTDTWEIVKIN